MHPLIQPVVTMLGIFFLALVFAGVSIQVTVMVMRSIGILSLETPVTD